MRRSERAEIDGCKLRDRGPEILKRDRLLDTSQCQVRAEGFLLAFDSKRRRCIIGRGSECGKRGRSVHGGPQYSRRMRIGKPPDAADQDVEGRKLRHFLKDADHFFESRLRPLTYEF